MITCLLAHSHDHKHVTSVPIPSACLKMAHNTKKYFLPHSVQYISDVTILTDSISTGYVTQMVIGGLYIV